MAEKMFKINEAIEIVYQAPNKETGLGGGVTAEIYLPSDAKDSNFPDLELTEIDSEGIYKDLFTPDEQGEWKVIIHKSNGEGQVVKRYSVGLHNVSSVGEGVSGVAAAVANVDGDVVAVGALVTNLDGDVVALDTKVDALPDAAGVNAEVDAALVDYDAPTKTELDAAHAATDGKIDALDTKVSSLDTPPMVS